MKSLVVSSCCAALVLAGAMPQQTTKELPLPGVYSAGYPEGRLGFFQIELYPDATAIFRSVISLHNPPVEVETLGGRLEPKTEGLFCFSPAPEAIADCVRIDEGGFIVETARAYSDEKYTVMLERTGDVEGRTAPPAVPKSPR